jgi:hypothetical protein
MGRHFPRAWLHDSPIEVVKHQENSRLRYDGFYAWDHQGRLGLTPSVAAGIASDEQN